MSTTPGDVVLIRDRLAAAEVASLYRAFRADVRPVRDPAEGGKFVYAEVDAVTVDPTVAEAGRLAAAWAARDLGLPTTPGVRWFAPETDADRAHVVRWGRRDWAASAWPEAVVGWCTPTTREVWLAADLNVLDVARTAAHEVRHLAQPDEMAPADAEADARAYEVACEGEICAAIIRHL